MGPYFYIVSALAVWSSWGLAVRGLDMPVHLIVFYNAVFAVIFQGTGILFISKRKGLELKSGLWPLVLLALCGLVNLLLFVYALRTATVAGALLTHYTAPVFVALFAPFFLGDRTGRHTLYALAVSAAGLALIFASGLSGGAGSVAGLAAGTASGLAYAFVIIISRGESSKHHPLKVVFVQGVLSLALLGAWLVPSGAVRLPGPGEAMVLAGLGLFHSTLAVMVYLYGIRAVTALEAGILGYLEPVLGILLAFVFLGETPGPLPVAGGLLILTAGSMVIYYGQPQYAGGVDDSRG